MGGVVRPKISMSTANQGRIAVNITVLIDVSVILIPADPIECTTASIKIYNCWGRPNCKVNSIAVQNNTYICQ